MPFQRAHLQTRSSTLNISQVIYLNNTLDHLNSVNIYFLNALTTSSTLNKLLIYNFSLNQNEILRNKHKLFFKI